MSASANFNVDAERLSLGITNTVISKVQSQATTVKGNSVQSGLTKDWTRATFIVRVSHLQKLKDFAYTEQISIKEALDTALERFLQDTGELLPYNKEKRTTPEVTVVDGEKIYDTKAVSSILSRNHVTVYNYIHSGELKATKIGKTFFITESDLREFVKNHNF